LELKYALILELEDSIQISLGITAPAVGVGILGTAKAKLLTQVFRKL
jgi:hypothetical protein